MQQTPYKLIPLTDGDKEWLMTMYLSRVRNLYTTFALYNVVFIVIAFSVMGFVFEAAVNDVFMDGQETWLVSGRFADGWPIKIGIAFVLASIFCALSYYRGALPYKLDAQSDMKQLAPFTITKKIYNAYDQQCLVWLLGQPKSFVIDVDAFNKHQDGDTIYMEQAIRSGYVFSLNDNYNIYA